MTTWESCCKTHHQQCYRKSILLFGLPQILPLSFTLKVAPYPAPPHSTARRCSLIQATSLKTSSKPACTLQETYKAPPTKQIIDVPLAAALQGRCDRVVNYSVGNRITDVNRRVQEVNPLSLLVYDKEWWSPQKLRRTSCPSLPPF